MLHLRLFCAPVNKMCLKIPEKPMRGDLLGLRTLTFFFPYKFMIIANLFYAILAYKKFHRNILFLDSKSP